jgi:hypothetical protein
MKVHFLKGDLKGLSAKMGLAERDINQKAFIKKKGAENFFYYQNLPVPHPVRNF